MTNTTSNPKDLPESPTSATSASSPSLTPRLVVHDAAAALDFYVAAFASVGAVERDRVTDPGAGRIVHAEMAIGDAVFFVTEGDGVHNMAPTDLDGSSLLLVLVVDDAQAVGAAFVAAGGEVVYPIQDQPYGRHEGRLRDPFGHLWIISRAEDVAA